MFFPLPEWSCRYRLHPFHQPPGRPFTFLPEAVCERSCQWRLFSLWQTHGRDTACPSMPGQLCWCFHVATVIIVTIICCCCSCCCSSCCCFYCCMWCGHCCCCYGSAPILVIAAPVVVVVVVVIVGYRNNEVIILYCYCIVTSAAKENQWGNW